MFKGTAFALSKQKKTVKPILDPELIPILSVERLLATGRQQVLFKDINQLIDIVSPEKKVFFMAALDQAVQFAQLFPETPGSYYSHKGGLLDHLLERAYLALSRCRTYMTPKEATTSLLSDEEQLWIFAVFSAALLLDVGRIPTNLVVSLFDQHGKALGRWNAFKGQMPIKAAYYKFHFEQENWESLRSQVTPIMATQLLSHAINDTDGFSWLASDKQVLEAWFGMLQQHHYKGKIAILTIITAIQAQTIASYFADFTKYLAPQKGQAAGMFPFQRSAQDDTRVLAGMAAAEVIASSRPHTAGLMEKQTKTNHQKFEVANRFINWLRKHIDEGAIVLHTADAAIRQNADFLQKKNGQVLISNREINKFFLNNQDMVTRYGKQQIMLRQLFNFNIIEKKVRQGFIINEIFAVQAQHVSEQEYKADATNAPVLNHSIRGKH